MLHPASWGPHFREPSHETETQTRLPCTPPTFFIAPFSLCRIASSATGNYTRALSTPPGQEAEVFMYLLPALSDFWGSAQDSVSPFWWRTFLEASQEVFGAWRELSSAISMWTKHSGWPDHLTQVVSGLGSRKRVLKCLLCLILAFLFYLHKRARCWSWGPRTDIATPCPQGPVTLVHLSPCPPSAVTAVQGPGQPWNCTCLHQLRVVCLAPPSWRVSWRRILCLLSLAWSFCLLF